MLTYWRASCQLPAPSVLAQMVVVRVDHVMVVMVQVEMGIVTLASELRRKIILLAYV